MIKSIKLVSNNNSTYDIVIECENNNAEFGLEFINVNNLRTVSERILNFIESEAKRVKISSVRIIMSGILITSIAFSSFISAFSPNNRYSMGYLYSGTDTQHIEYVNRTNGALGTVSPSYFDIKEDGSLKLNYLSEKFINEMHSRGINVVPFLSNHWNRTGGINALKDVELLSNQVANYIEKYNLDGVNVDIENVTHEQREQYAELVRLLREKIPSDKEVSVAVAANPNGWEIGWHGSYDYTKLAKYADHLLIMAYDEHYEGGSAGPVSSISFVENSIKYALGKTSPDKIVVGIPLYGRVWSLSSSRIVGKGISIEKINDILKNCESTVTFDETSKSVKAEFEIKDNSPVYTAGGDFVLTPGKYVVWYENDESYNSKLNLVSKYNLKGVGSWALGQEDSSIWSNYKNWLNGSSNGSTSSKPETSMLDKNTGTAGGSSKVPEKVSESLNEVSKIPEKILETPEEISEVPYEDLEVTEKVSDIPDKVSETSEEVSEVIDEDPETSISFEDNDVQLPKLLENKNQGAFINKNEKDVKIYKNKDLTGEVIAVLPGGTPINIIENFENGVCQIKLLGGQIGYVSSKHVTIQNIDI